MVRPEVRRNLVKVAILAGGRGTRLAEETDIRPKPLVEIGGRPILWHIMKHYAGFGYNEFVIALGYKGGLIRDVFAPGGTYGNSDGNGACWSVNLVDTGEATMTGGRIKRLAPELGNETFFLTWGDGVSNIDLARLLEFHRSHGRLATLSAVRPPPRFGQLQLEGDRVNAFAEKPPHSEGWINGAFFILEPGVFEYIEGDATQWEREPMERLAAAGELMAYRHHDFWQCMDTIHDRNLLQDYWDSGNVPWMVWKSKKDSRR